MIFRNKYPYYRQTGINDCGPTCLRMIAQYYGRNYDIQILRNKMDIARDGVSMLSINDAAESIGFNVFGMRLTFEQFINEATHPCILHWNKKHFVVCYAIKKNKILISDPSSCKAYYSIDDFKKLWISNEKEETGTVLFLEPTIEFYRQNASAIKTKQNIKFFLNYLTPFRKNLLQIILGMLTVSILQLIFPFLMQSLVDNGIKNKNISFITLILIAQFIIFIARLSVDCIRSWILLHINMRISISLISDFLTKLMKLPLSFFDTKRLGDILQRIGDHDRIKLFLTGSSLNILFSFFNIIVFSCILGIYNLKILGLFILGNGLYIIWVIAFMRYRRNLDIKRFVQSAGEQNNLFQLVTGMPEIKLNNCETEKRWEWEKIQVKLYNISIKILAIEQFQQLGSIFFSQSTNILITFISAKAVIYEEMTLGMMMSLIYIVGQLTAPIEQFISFARSLQDAKISLERLSEIHQLEDEEVSIETKQKELPPNKNISIENLNFSYNGSKENLVLNNINVDIPYNMVTAIVGASGSGKTTLLKLLLGFYTPSNGSIRIDNTLIQDINPHTWRASIGSVLQDGFIFSDSIMNNIIIGNSEVDWVRLEHAVNIANIKEFIESLPLGYNTHIGIDGNGISQGQRQRILIARAVYKNPDFIFLDEATNALDTNNEKIIIENLQSFYKNRTVIIVAHRLSTVCDADKIIVLEKGHITEEGTHAELVSHRGIYYHLVKDQLDLRK